MKYNPDSLTSIILTLIKKVFQRIFHPDINIFTGEFHHPHQVALPDKRGVTQYECTFSANFLSKKNSNISHTTTYTDTEDEK